MFNDIFGLYLWLALFFSRTALVCMILFSLLETFGSRYYQLGCFCVQVTETSTQSGINNKEMYHYLTEKTVRGWEEPGWLHTGSVVSLGPSASHFPTPLSSGSVQGQYMSAEVPKVISDIFNAQGKQKGSCLFLSLLLGVGKSFLEVFPLALIST